MKNKLLLLGGMFLAVFVQGQHMQVKRDNFSTFHADKKVDTEVLDKQSSASGKQHHEYGVLPYASPCSDCAEVIDKRTIDSRYFINSKDETHFYSQQSFFPLHYKLTADDVWRTIDPRLRPGGDGVYAAKDQPVPTKCDLSRKSTSLITDAFEFEFNKNLTLYFFDENTLYTERESANYSDYTVGEGGLRVKNLWSGIDMEQIFSTGEIKTNFIIPSPLLIPISKGWMVIEDHFTLPENVRIVEEEHGTRLPEGFYRGDYLLQDVSGKTVITYGKPVYYDTRVFGMHGIYNLLHNGNEYTLQMLVPVEWLTRADNVYPLTIDPLVYGTAKYGDFLVTGLPSANMGFTSIPLGSCDYHMTVNVPGATQLTNALIDLEYQLTYDNTCGTPPLPPPFCTFNQVNMEVECDSCGTTTGQLYCNPALPPYTGTCSTDSNLVFGAHAYAVTSFVPNYLSCYTGQCSSYSIPFTLHNRNTVCGDICGYLCARGNMWRVTVEGYIDSSIIATPSITAHNDTLISSATNNNQWYLNGSAINGATSPVFIATQVGVYHVSVSDSSGCYNVTSNTIDFNCAAQFSILNPNFFPWLPGADSGYYYGINYSIGNNLNYLWDFGDGTTSTMRNPTHDYAQPGHYFVCLTVSNSLCTNTRCDSSFYVFKTEGGLMTKLIIQDPTGIDDLDDNKLIRIYPNPAYDVLMISLKGVHEVQINIFSAEGKLVKEIEHSTTKDIDISGFAKGVYIAELKAGEMVKRARWVKM